MVFLLTEKALDCMRTQRETQAMQHLQAATEYAKNASDIRTAMVTRYDHRDAK
jgi:hypothetical protein